MVCIAISSWIGIYIVKNGDPNIIISPYDAMGNFCGRDAGFEEYPYLWYQDLAATNWLVSSVCVKECPTWATKGIECKKTANVDNCQPTVQYDSALFLDRWCTPVYSSLPDDI